MIKVVNTVKVYEFNGEEAKETLHSEIHIFSHGLCRDKVDIVIEGKRFTVFARDVEAAIKNATNTAQY